MSMSSHSAQYSDANSNLQSRKCYCGLIAPVRTAGTKRNIGRRFMGCARYGEMGACNFFDWVETKDHSESGRDEAEKMNTFEAESVLSEKVKILKLELRSVVEFAKKMEEEKLKLEKENKKLKFEMQEKGNKQRCGALMKIFVLLVLGYMYNEVSNNSISDKKLEEWERTEYPDIQPWIVKKPPGRPRKKRICAPDEPKNPYKSSRAGGYVLCGKCKQRGHNARRCSANITGETAWQARQRRQAERVVAQNATAETLGARANPSHMEPQPQSRPQNMPTVTARGNFTMAGTVSATQTPSMMPPPSVRPPKPPTRPNYTADTMAAASKRIRRTEVVASSSALFKNPKRASNLEDLAVRMGNIRKGAIE